MALTSPLNNPIRTSQFGTVQRNPKWSAYGNSIAAASSAGGHKVVSTRNVVSNPTYDPATGMFRYKANTSKTALRAVGSGYSSINNIGILKLREAAANKGISMPDKFWKELETNPYRSGKLINNPDSSTTWMYDPNGLVYDYGSMSIEGLKSIADAYNKGIDLRTVDPRNWIHELSSKPSTRSFMKH